MPAKIEPLRLQSIELFRGLTPEQTARISERIYCRTYTAGTDIIIAEQPGEVVYILLSGTVKIHVQGTDGAEVVLAILGPGDIVGEISLLDSAGRSASAVTLEDSQLLWMGAQAFQECLRTLPVISQNLTRILAGRMRLANELIQALATLDVNGRVARQVLAFAERYGQAGEQGVLIPLRLTQGDLADLVGASRKRVNQTMVLFKGQGLLFVEEKGRIIVQDVEGLKRYCV